jgi:hypothetical protein
MIQRSALCKLRELDRDLSYSKSEFSPRDRLESAGPWLAATPIGTRPGRWLRLVEGRIQFLPDIRFDRQSRSSETAPPTPWFRYSDHIQSGATPCSQRQRIGPKFEIKKCRTCSSPLLKDRKAVAPRVRLTGSIDKRHERLPVDARPFPPRH